jgi:hypothetical protein
MKKNTKALKLNRNTVRLMEDHQMAFAEGHGMRIRSPRAMASRIPAVPTAACADLSVPKPRTARRRQAVVVS